MASLEEELKKVLDFKLFITIIAGIDLSTTEKNQREKIECFLAFPFFLLATAKEMLALRKKDILFMKRGKNLIISAKTEFETVNIIIKKYHSLYYEAFEKHLDMLDHEDFFFMSTKEIKYRYQSFQRMLVNHYPMPIMIGNQKYKNFTAHPYKEIKSVINTKFDFIQKINARSKNSIKKSS